VEGRMLAFEYLAKDRPGFVKGDLAKGSLAPLRWR
jgi:hypothetical protein